MKLPTFEKCESAFFFFFKWLGHVKEREIGGGHARLCLICNVGSRSVSRVQAGVELQVFLAAQKATKHCYHLVEGGSFYFCFVFLAVGFVNMFPFSLHFGWYMQGHEQQTSLDLYEEPKEFGSTRHALKAPEEALLLGSQ